MHRFLANPQLAWITLWIGLAFLIVALIVMIRTSWGQSHPLRKCAALSLLAHLLLAGYATTVQIVMASGNGRRGSVDVLLVDGNPDGNADFGPIDGDDPGTGLASTNAVDPAVASNGSDDVQNSSAQQPAQIAAAPAVASQAIPPEPRPAPPPLLDVAVSKPETKPAEPLEQHAADDAAAKHDDPEAAPKPNVAESPVSQTPEPTKPAEIATEPLPPPDALATLPRMPDPPSTSTDGQWVSGDSTGATRSVEPAPQGPLNDGAHQPESNTNQVEGNRVADSSNPADHSTIGIKEPTGALSDHGPNNSVAGPVVENAAAPIASRATPQIYSDRTSSDRAAILRERGGSPEGESAVQAALHWLAENQSADGHWDADRFGAGHEMAEVGRTRLGARQGNSTADSAVTGLAVLALLGAGNTHLQGDYAHTVQRSLEYLLSIQAADGNLAGNAETYMFMYSHGMATLAVSEAYAMTGDKRLEPAVRAAIGFTVAAQIPITGGWRYRAHEPATEMGDTSQLGWQLMSLKIAEMAGLEMPQRTRDGIVRFIKSVSMGANGGIASYQPGVRKPSRTMTAEALVCRQFMGMSRDNPASNEAGDFLMSELPAPERINLYYWYYGTLGMYQLQGDHWQRWNTAMQNTLVKRQRLDGDVAGSWDPECIWGGYGGRVYSTAMSALCLEVYYRYLPIYRAANKDLPLSAK